MAAATPPVAGVLHRICATYAAVGVAVPPLWVAVTILMIVRPGLSTGVQERQGALDHLVGSLVDQEV
ncbi:MAG: hypothetical protein QOI25_5318 [Mycobacterium sp.]|jgi:hypothetical protein|nr:hypothetical protein [Mycobacterium sp.]